jgi:hypothetical protein
VAVITHYKMANLRKRLQEMTEVTDVSRHSGLLTAMTQEIPNTIKLVASPYSVNRYTCLVHVFGFAEKTEYIEIARRGFNVGYASPDFAHWLIGKGFLSEIDPQDVQDGDLVFYFNVDGRFKHAGIMVSKERVLSKWGTGHLFEHALDEVPESYGAKTRFFKNLKYEEAFEHFKTYVRKKGMLL